MARRRLVDELLTNRIGGRRRFLASALKAARQGLRSLARLQLNRDQTLSPFPFCHIVFTSCRQLYAA